MALERGVPSRSPRTCVWDLIQKVGLCRCNGIKGLEMRPSWIM